MSAGLQYKHSGKSSIMTGVLSECSVVMHVRFLIKAGARWMTGVALRCQVVLFSVALRRSKTPF